MLPKVELHCHLDGCLRINTILELAQQDNISLPSSNPTDLKKILSIGRKRGTLEEYISRFDITLSVMQTPESLKRIAYELIEDVATENIRYIEVRYSPIQDFSQFYDQCPRNQAPYVQSLFLHLR